MKNKRLKRIEAKLDYLMTVMDMVSPNVAEELQKERQYIQGLDGGLSGNEIPRINKLLQGHKDAFAQVIEYDEYCIEISITFAAAFSSKISKAINDNIRAAMEQMGEHRVLTIKHYEGDSSLPFYR